MTTAESIKKIRLAFCLSQREFAKAINVSHGCISRYENGERKPSFAVIRRMIAYAKEHGIDLDYQAIRKD